MKRFLIPIGALGALAVAPWLALAAAPAPPPAPDYDRDVRPILARTCFACHGFDAGRRQAGLRLDTADGAQLRLKSGKQAVVPFNLKASELWRRVSATNALRMPPESTGKTLKPEEREVLRRWIAAGAKYAPHWALVPPKQPPLPAVKQADWCRNPIDRFILARLEKEGLRPSPEADPVTLIRRVTLDLTGLPPTPAEVDQFVAESESERPKLSPRTDKTGHNRTSVTSPTPYTRLVDRLLASPRFGERMAWDWLDAARYADTNGYQGDRTRTMWPWRDWVVRAFNADVPYDRFTVEQLAGDLLPNATVEQRLATGFHRNHMLNGEGGRIPEESRVDYVVDRADTTATVWLGLTLGCSRCHDHKFDPFTQKEYYGLYAFFNNLPETGSVDRGGNANPVLPLPTPEQSARISELTGTVEERRKAAEALLAGSPERAAADKALEAARTALRQAQAGVVEVMVMQERPQPRDTFVLIRGAYDRYGEKVTPGVPASLPPLPSGAPPNRLGLAEWLVSPDHPLTGRVAVNRTWQMLFGTGLVKTAEDFGVQGERPSHPELLDYLAVLYSRPASSRGNDGEKERLRDRATDGSEGLGWSTKALIRLIVTSATYRQSSALPPSASSAFSSRPNPQSIDPENRLLWRGPRFRLSSAMLRDQALAVSGLLVDRMGGPAVKPYQPPGVWEDATFGKITYQQDHGEALYRRTLYTFWRRIVAPTELFDTATRQTCTVRQARTNTPLHALTLLNDVTFVEAARALAQRAMTEGGSTPEERIQYAFRLATCRRPEAREVAVLRARLDRLRREYAADPGAAKALLKTGESPRDERLDPVEHAAYMGVCSLILNLDEVVTRE